MNILSNILTEGGVGYLTANENFFILDAFSQLSVKDRDLTAPPGSPVEGDRYLVKATATGDWTGKEAKIAIYHNLAWIFFTVQEGWRFWVDDENVFLIWDGSAYKTATLT